MVQLSKNPQDFSKVYLTNIDFGLPFWWAWLCGSAEITEVTAQGTLAVDLLIIDAFPGNQNILKPKYVTIHVSLWHISLTCFLYKGKCFLIVPRA